MNNELKRINNMISKQDFKFSDLISVQIQENHSQTISDNSLSRAIVGNYLAGSTGAIIGAMSSKKNVTQKVTAVTLILIFKNMQTPYFRLNFFIKESGVERNNETYLQSLHLAQTWYGRFSVIIEENKIKQDSIPSRVF